MAKAESRIYAMRMITQLIWYGIFYRIIWYRVIGNALTFLLQVLRIIGLNHWLSGVSLIIPRKLMNVLLALRKKIVDLIIDLIVPVLYMIEWVYVEIAPHLMLPPSEKPQQFVGQIKPRSESGCQNIIEHTRWGILSRKRRQPEEPQEVYFRAASR